MNIKKILSGVIFSTIFLSLHAEVVEAIEINGLSLVSQDTVSAWVDVSVGQNVDASVVESQIASLYQSGLFEQVSIQLENNVLTIHLTEQPIVRNIEIESSMITEDQVIKSLREIGIMKAELLHETKLEEYRVFMEQSLRVSGFNNAKVETIIDRKGSTADLQIVFHEGAATKLREINLVGNIKLPERDVFRVIQSRTTGFMSFIGNDDLFSQQMLEEDRERIVDFYKSRGYLAPSVVLRVEDIEPFQRMWDADYKKATYDINAGALFYIDKVTFDDSEDVWPEDLKETIRARAEGMSIGPKLYGAIRDALQEYFEADALRDFYRVEPDPEISGYDKANLKLVLDKKVSRVRFINFEGNRGTFDEPLRRAITVQEARPFNDFMVRESEKKLRNLGYLKNAKIEKVKIADGVYDLSIVVSEAQTAQGNLQFDFGNGFSLSANASDSNVLGTGNAISVNLSASLQQQQLSLSYVQPNVNLSGHTLSNMLSYTRQSKDNKETMRYHVDKFNYVLGYSMPISRHTRVDLGGGVLFDQYYEVNKASSIVRDFFENRDTFVQQYKLSGGVSYQDVDSAYMPTKGLTSFVNTTINLPLQDSLTLFQCSAQAIGYYPLAEAFDQPIVFRGRVWSQFVVDYADSNVDVPFFSRLYAGGVGTVRGYAPGSLGPKYFDEIIEEAVAGGTDTVVYKKEKVKGGNKLLVTNWEIQMPSPMPDFVTPYIFVDMGNVFDESETITFENLRGSGGVSVSVRLPMGTFMGSAAVPFNKKIGDDFKPFSFGFGTMF